MNNVFKFFVMATALILMQGCSTLKENKSSKMEYLIYQKETVAKVPDADSSKILSQIESDLIRGKVLGMHSIAVMPYTVPFIYAQAEKDAYKEKWSQSKLQEKIDQDVRKYTNGKQYFRMMSFTHGSTIKIDPEAVHGELMDSDGKKYSLHVARGTVSNTTYETRDYTYVPRYVGNTYAPGYTYAHLSHNSHSTLDFYVDTEIDFSKEFMLHLDLRYDSHLKPFTLTWKVK